MAYEVRIVGTNDSITVDNDQGMRVRALYEDDGVSDSAKINIGEQLVVRKGQIRFIRRVEDSLAASRRSNEVVSDTNRENDRIYEEWAAKSPEIRSRRDGMFRMAYRAIHGSGPGRDVLDALSVDLRRFFADNPRRTYGDGSVYVAHLGREKRSENIGGTRMAALRLMERVIAEDIVTAGKHVR